MKTTVLRIFTVLLSLTLMASVFACTKGAQIETTPEPSAVPIESATSEPVVEATEQPTAEPTEEPKPELPAEPVRVGALAGPTGVGLSYLMDQTDRYSVELFTAPDQLSPKIIKGEVDIAAVPINLASVLYQKTNGAVSVIAVNTLGVLYFLENGDTIHSVNDLAGKTIYATGQGSTPEYVLAEILRQNDLVDSVQVEYIADNTDLIAKLIAGEAEVALLPEPHVSVACTKGETVRVALSANNLWQEHNEAALVQGVYIVRKAYLEEHADAVNQFLADAAASAERVKTDENAAVKVVEYGIIPAAPIAKKAIPNCNIVLETGESMKKLVSAMLDTLYQANPASVGGTLPDEAFYYVP